MLNNGYQRQTPNAQLQLSSFEQGIKYKVKLAEIVMKVNGVLMSPRSVRTYFLPEHVRPSFSRRYPIGHEQLYDPTVFKQLSVKVQRFRLEFPHSLTSAYNI